MNLRPRPTAHPREGIVRGWRTSQLLIRRKYQASFDLSFRPPPPPKTGMHSNASYGPDVDLLSASVAETLHH